MIAGCERVGAGATVGWVGTCVGALVLGATVGATVVGATVVGATVVGATVVGTVVLVGGVYGVVVGALEVVGGCRVEPSLAGAAAESRYQFERQGYFCVDMIDSKPDQLVFNRTVALRDTWSKIEKKSK